MTQSGQGDEPQLPAVREGVVLPAQGDPWPPEPSDHSDRTGHQHGAPAGGQAWGQPWGPQDAPQGAGPLPPEGAPYGPSGQAYGAPQPGPGQSYGLPSGADQPYGPPPQAPGQSFGPPSGADQSYGAPQGWAPQQPLPQQQSPQHHQPPAYQQPQPPQQPLAYQQPEQPQPPAYAQPQPGRQPQPEPYTGAADETQVLPPQPAGDAEATQYLPPVPGAGAGHAARPQPPQQPSASAPLPPENRPAKAEAPGESTTQLRTVRPGRGAHRGRPQQSAPAAPAGAAEETAVLPAPVPAAAPPKPAPSRRARQQQQQQPPKPTGSPFAIRPGRPGDRPPPSEFDGLFRADGAAAPGAGAGSPGETQQLPQFSAPAPAPGDAGGGHGGRGGRVGRRRPMSPAVLVGIVVAGCGIAGLAAGAALSAGGDDGKRDDNTTLGSSEPSDGQSEPSKSADPAEPQAKSLDALLKDSNNSRSAVINAVNNIKSCKALPKAASDLRTAARQRNDLVTRLGKLTIDKLPNHTELTASLTKAWKSSAQADSQYAAWADQARGKKGCHKGQARRTGRVGAAERASGEATAAKRKAAELWNPLAGKYNLTKHEATQL
ncbi:hypothetical protein [Streptomyces sp. NBRC 110028]|uniref:hypothetical protein n=1 Tax=Streptomyces sp. NBRC 110028 TaxID=1621260 RepID=UPI0006E23364|nr:hypothetical protein [Streptomyces sp. NBRC 110028]